MTNNMKQIQCRCLFLSHAIMTLIHLSIYFIHRNRVIYLSLKNYIVPDKTMIMRMKTQRGVFFFPSQIGCFQRAILYRGVTKFLVAKCPYVKVGESDFIGSHTQGTYPEQRVEKEHVKR